MGTSASLGGIGGGSPLIPDWVEDPDGDGQSPTQDGQSNGDDQPAQEVPLAPQGPFASARRALGEFASSGDRKAMRRGVANYIRKGRGGAQMAARRSAGSAARGAALSGIVGGNPAFDDVRQAIRNAVSDLNNADELLAAIAEAASPSDGTNDSQTGQDAAAEALQHLVTIDNEVDLLNLDSAQKETLLERFLAIDAFRLFMTDISKHLQGKASPKEFTRRAREIKDYFCETFRQANRSRIDGLTLGNSPDTEVRRLSRSVIAEAYLIFESVIDES